MRRNRPYKLNQRILHYLDKRRKKMTPYPLFKERITTDLNRLWDFKFIEKNICKEVDLRTIQYDDRLPVPSAFDAFPAYAGKRGLGIYRCFVDVEKNMTSLLKVGGAGMTAKVYIDGILIHQHIGIYTPFEVKLPAVEKVTREIVVITDNRYDYDNCPLYENYFDFYNYGGIIRQVWLETLPDNPIISAYVHTEDWIKGKIRVCLKFTNKIDSVTFSIDDGKCKAAKPKEIDDNNIEFTALVPDPSPWSVDAPNLHTITINSADDSITIRFGLRQIKTEKGNIILNDEPIKLLGYCRHETHPQFGPATPEALMVADLQILKDMGCNFIRGSHYQQDPRFLDLCDELGFVVFSESTAWNPDKKQLTDQKFIKAQLEQTKAMVLTDFNHPSIIIWGFLYRR